MRSIRQQGGAPIADRLFLYASDLARSALPDWTDGSTDADLVAAATADPAAFSLLYQRYGERIYSFVRARVGHPEDAADITQRVFLESLRDLGQLHRSGDRFRAWLFTLARHGVIDHYRAQSGASKRLPEHRIETMREPAVDRSAEDEVMQREELRRLRRLVYDLDPEKQEMIALRFVGGLSAREIGEITGQRETAVRKQLSRIVRSLKEKYDATND